MLLLLVLVALVFPGLVLAGPPPQRIELGLVIGNNFHLEVSARNLRYADDDAIRALSLEEIGYLTRKLIAGVVALTDRAEGLAKNGDSPSTSRSTRQRAAASTKGTRTAAGDAGRSGE